MYSIMFPYCVEMDISVSYHR